MKTRIFIYFFTALLCGCASSHPVKKEVLAESGLLGRWQSMDSDSTMTIYCSGAFSREWKRNYFLLGPTAGNESGSHISEINPNTFVVGTLLPITKSTYHVTQWPKSESGIKKMTVDRENWKLVSSFDCTE